jgi:hypothetical protein
MRRIAAGFLLAFTFALPAASAAILPPVADEASPPRCSPADCPPSECTMTMECAGEGLCRITCRGADGSTCTVVVECSEIEEGCEGRPCPLPCELRG